MYDMWIGFVIISALILLVTIWFCYELHKARTSLETIRRKCDWIAQKIINLEHR